MKLFLKNILLITSITAIITCNPKITENFVVKVDSLEEKLSFNNNKSKAPLTQTEKTRLIDNLNNLKKQIIYDHEEIEKFRIFCDINPAISLDENYSFIRNNEEINTNYNKNHDIYINLVQNRYSEIEKIIILINDKNYNPNILYEKIINLQSEIKIYHDSFIFIFNTIEKDLKNITCQPSNTNCIKTKILEGLKNQYENFEGINVLKSNIEKTQKLSENILN